MKSSSCTITTSRPPLPPAARIRCRRPREGARADTGLSTPHPTSSARRRRSRPLRRSRRSRASRRRRPPAAAARAGGATAAGSTSGTRRGTAAGEGLSFSPPPPLPPTPPLSLPLRGRWGRFPLTRTRWEPPLASETAAARPAGNGEKGGGRRRGWHAGERKSEIRALLFQPPLFLLSSLSVVPNSPPF